MRFGGLASPLGPGVENGLPLGVGTLDDAAEDVLERGLVDAATAGKVRRIVAGEAAGPLA